MNSYHVHDSTTRNNVMGHIADLNLDRAWTVDIKRYQSKRTRSQNSLLHQWIGEIADYTGHSHAEIKDFLKAMFMAPTSITTFNGVTTEHRHTAELDIAQMSVFMERISAFAHGELGVRLTIPEAGHER